MKSILAGLMGGLLMAGAAMADDRVFGFTYEPGTSPKGEIEFEQWIDSGLGRNAAVGQQDYARFLFREELEYGVTDNYQVSLYFNHELETYRDPATGDRKGGYRQAGFSFENKYMVLDPNRDKVGLALYLEPSYDGSNFELEQKLILGKQVGEWRWAFNLTHATEWSDNFREAEGELEGSFGLARRIAPRWWLGFEIRDHNELPKYKEWENTALFLGPTVCYTRKKWFATLSVMPQIYGANFTGDPDNNHRLELEGHERLSIRFVCGFDF